MEIKRTVQAQIESWLFKQKVIIILGARQVGKTTLSRQLLKKYGSEEDYFNCDLLSVRRTFENNEAKELKRIIGKSKFIVIDEAQRVKDIGITLKIIHDTYPDIQIIATGSSSFDLASKTNEPLTGRSIEFQLFPFSIGELSQIYKKYEFASAIQQFLRFGTYPEIVGKSEKDSILLLEQLTSNYLFKDILEFEQIKKPDLIVKLLQLLALQIGSEVSRHELATALGVNRNTIDRYIDMLEKSFVIFRLKPLSRNLRKEITKKDKIYFYDLGIRNALISRFNNLEVRDDIGGIWENLCIVERMKYLSNNMIFHNKWFWRTHDQKEVDYIEEYNGKFEGYEFKWLTKKVVFPKDFLEAYPNSTISLVNLENCLEFFGE